MSFMAARQFAWRQTEITSTVSKQARAAERGRGGGIFDLADQTERNNYNSDDEEVDDFGRRKKKRAKKNDGGGQTKPQSGIDMPQSASPDFSQMASSASMSQPSPPAAWSGLFPQQMPQQGYDTSGQFFPSDGSMWPAWAGGQSYGASAQYSDGNLWPGWGSGEQSTPPGQGFAQPMFSAWGEQGQGSQATASFPSSPASWSGQGAQAQSNASFAMPGQATASFPSNPSSWNGKGAQAQSNAPFVGQATASFPSSPSGWTGKGQAQAQQQQQSQPNATGSPAWSGQDQQKGEKGSTPTNGNLTLEQLHARLPCKFFAEGHCKNGQNCTFRHVTTEQARSVSGLKARRYCNYFGQGKCLRGVLCPYIHGTEEVNDKPNIEKLASEAGATFVDFETGLPKVVEETPKPAAHPQMTMTQEELDKKNLTVTKSGTIRLKAAPTK